MGFTLSHRKEHFIRALMEASAYAVRHNTDQLQAIGLALQEIRIVGGAAILALVGSGLIPSLQQAVDASVKVIETRQPQPAIQARYNEFYQLYRSTYFALLPVFEEAAKITL